MPPRKDYSKKRYTHPLKQKNQKHHAPFSATTKKYISRTVLVIVFVGLVYAVFFSPWLIIKNISIEGSRHANVYTLSSVWLDGQGEKRCFSKFACNHYLFIQTEELEDALLRDKYVRSVNINKKFPNTLVVQINERLESLAYFFEGSRYIIDENGELIEATEAVLEENDPYMGLPMVLATSTDTSVSGVVKPDSFSKELTEFIVSLNSEFPKLFKNIAITKFMIGDRGVAVTAITSDGWYAIFDPSVDMVVQLSNLSRVYYEVIGSSNRKSFEYIDVRLENYAYYK